MTRRILAFGVWLVVCAAADGASFNIADLNKDGIVDAKDLGILSDNWLKRIMFEEPDIEFVSIPGGAFLMGDESGVGGANERPTHAVALSAFECSKYEVTNGQYALFLNAAKVDGLIKVVNGIVYGASDDENSEPYLNTSSVETNSYITYGGGVFGVGSWQTKSMANHPVVEVTWYGARAFCEYYGWRLPTEAEWEYAARGEYHDPYYMYPWGSNDIDATMLNYDNNVLAPRTTAVGTYPAYGYGLCDMAGNVFEWCSDWYGEDYYGVSAEVNPEGAEEGVFKVLRGGYYRTIANGCRVAYRYKNTPQSADSYGFRCVRSVEAAVWTEKSIYSPGEDIVVHFGNASGDAKDWIGIYPVGAGNGAFIKWKRTDGAGGVTAGITEGSVVFGGIDEAGDYEVRLFFHDSYQVEARWSFSVGGAG